MLVLVCMHVSLKGLLLHEFLKCCALMWKGWHHSSTSSFRLLTRSEPGHIYNGNREWIQKFLTLSKAEPLLPLTSHIHCGCHFSCTVNLNERHGFSNHNFSYSRWSMSVCRTEIHTSKECPMTLCSSQRSRYMAHKSKKGFLPNFQCTVNCLLWHIEGWGRGDCIRGLESWLLMY